ARAPVWLQSLFFGALISAVFSTCSGALLAPSSILAENLIKPLLLKSDDEERFLLVSRVAVVIMAIIATLIAFSSDSIYDLVAQSSIFGAVSILVPMLFALFAKRKSREGAWLSMSLGLTGYLYFEYWQPGFAVPALFMGVLLSVGGMLLGYALAGKAAPPGFEH